MARAFTLAGVFGLQIAARPNSVHRQTGPAVIAALVCCIAVPLRARVASFALRGFASQEVLYSGGPKIAIQHWALSAIHES